MQTIQVSTCGDHTIAILHPVTPRLGEIGTLNQIIAEINLCIDDPDPDRERARLRAKAIATPWNAPLYFEYIASQGREETK